jgi:hypothetical protein
VFLTGLVSMEELDMLSLLSAVGSEGGVVVDDGGRGRTTR